MVSLGIEHDYDVLDGVGHNLAAIYEGLGEKNWAFYSSAFTERNPKAMRNRLLFLMKTQLLTAP